MPENLPSITNQANELAELFPVMNPATAGQVREILEANMGPAGFSEANMERIKVPAGGALNWTIEGIDGEEVSRELSGIVVGWRDVRLYWKTAFAERGKARTPPDCTSKNSLVGIGDPGGDCTHCPLAEFGSDPKGGRGQACKQVRQLLMLLPGRSMPAIVGVPPTSRRNAVKFFDLLSNRMIPYWGLVTTLKLERVANADGIDYGRVVFSAGPRLTETQRHALAPYQKKVMEALRSTVVETEYEVVSDDFPPPPKSGAYAEPTDD